MRECPRRRAWEIGKLLAFAFVILACALPVSADTLAASLAVVPDRLFDTSLSASTSEFPTSGTELLPRAEDNGDGLLFAGVPSTETFDLLTNAQSERSESGGEGVRRFILLAILFGGALRFLTSSMFYDWAADIFDPFDGY